MVTARQQLPWPGSRSPRAPRVVVTLAVATVGLGLNVRAWTLLGPHLRARFDVGAAEYVLLMGLPLLVAAVIRLPAGVLTDRYGARVMFPAVSLVAAVTVVGLGLADPFPAVVAAGAAAGVAGTAFVVGASLVSRTVPYGQRGLALGVYGLGTVVAAAISLVSRGADPGGRRAALVLGGLLVGFAVLAALVLRDDVSANRAESPIRRCVEMTRLAAATSLSMLYLLALGGMVAIAVYLPPYLVTVFHLGWRHAFVVTGVIVMLASAGRLLGGWWTDKRPSARLLMYCYAVAALLCIGAALEPRRWWVTAPVIAAIGVCDGVASGALLALIGKAARPDSVGAVMGVTGAVAALGAVVLPLTLAGVERLGHSYFSAWVLLATVLLAAAHYVRAKGLHIGLGLAVQFEPESRPTAMTVALVDESETRLGAPAIVARLAELAVSDELLVVYGAEKGVRARLGDNLVLLGLRDRLPRYTVVALRVALEDGALAQAASLLGELVEAGTLPIAVSPAEHRRRVAAELSSYLDADRVLVVSYSPATGADLREVWRRAAPAAEGP
jgi:NNP family nitrate/nitrite transporter-like MFS transporter